MSYWGVSRKVFAVIAIAFATQNVLAQGVDEYPFASGNAMFPLCTSSSAGTKSMCIAFIAGAVAGANLQASIHSKPAFFCTPKGTTNGQYSDVVINYLRDYPQKRHEDGLTLIFMAMHDAFPCAAEGLREAPKPEARQK